MPNFAIQVQNLGKEYIIGGAEQHHESFREMLIGSLSSPLRKLRKLGGKTAADERFWALKNINFDVNHGDIVGIIGRNGAGKSTLLKILSRITQPTEGRVVTYGRVASLLEVGTGFHPELTGRENVFLNGAILGMSRNEIESKFDEIVAFAEVEKFLETPVKRYSSGMYVRLAFAVAAHLEPEILLVDEVLAVGDNEFQKKCLGKMSEVAGEGRTVLFVSHNMSAISALCSRAILLENGRILCDGEVEEAFENYFGSNEKNYSGWKAELAEQDSSHKFLQAASIYDSEGELRQSIAYQEAAAVKIRFTSPDKDDQYKLVVRLTNMMGVHVFASWDTDCQPMKMTQAGKEYESKCEIPPALLKPGRYLVTVSLIMKSHGNAEEIEKGEFEFEVTAKGFGEGLNRWGVVVPKLQWVTTQIRENNYE